MDLDMEPSASQSQDCEPTPPLQRHGSKSNFFLPPNSMNQSLGPQYGQMMPPNGDESPGRPPIVRTHYPRGSPHPRPRVMDGGRGATPDNIGEFCCG